MTKLKTKHKQRGFSQKNKLYPMRLNNTAIKRSTQKRLDSKQHTDLVKITARQKKLLHLLNDPKFLKPNGKPNLTAIARKLKIKSRDTLYRDIAALKKNKSIYVD